MGGFSRALAEPYVGTTGFVLDSLASARASPSGTSIRRFRDQILSKFRCKRSVMLGFASFRCFEAKSKPAWTDHAGHTSAIRRSFSSGPPDPRLYPGKIQARSRQGTAQSSLFDPPFRGCHISFFTHNPLIGGGKSFRLGIFFEVASHFFTNLLRVCLLCNSSAMVTRITYKIRRVLIPVGSRERWSGDNSENQQDLRE
jgi:hypothetical protein